MDINLGTTNTLAKPALPAARSLPSHNNPRASENRWLMQMEHAMLALGVKSQSNDVEAAETLPTSANKLRKHGTTPFNGSLFGAGPAGDNLHRSQQDEKDLLEDQGNPVADVTQMNRLHISSRDHSFSHATSNASELNKLKGYGTTSAHSPVNASSLAASSTQSSLSGGNFSPHAIDIACEPNKLTGYAVTSTHLDVSASSSAASSIHSSLSAASEIQTEGFTKRMNFNAALNLMPMQVHSFSPNLGKNGGFATTSIAPATFIKLQVPVQRPEFALPQIILPADGDELAPTGKRQFKQMDGESYSAKKLHLYHDESGIQAWVRDLGITEMQARALWMNMSSEMHGLGQRLSTLTVNGKKILSTSETKLSDDSEKNLPEFNEGEIIISQLPINVIGGKNAY